MERALCPAIAKGLFLIKKPVVAAGYSTQLAAYKNWWKDGTKDTGLKRNASNGCLTKCGLNYCAAIDPLISSIRMRTS